MNNCLDYLQIEQELFLCLMNQDYLDIFLYLNDYIFIPSRILVIRWAINNFMEDENLKESEE